MFYFEKDIETISDEGLKRIQLERLKALAAYVHDRIPFYQNQFTAKKIDVSKFKSLDDLEFLPFTTKSALRDRYGRRSVS